MDWAKTHSFWDAWHPVKGVVLRSLRPVLQAWMWILTRTVGTASYFPWHASLVGSFFIALIGAGLTGRYLTGQRNALYLSFLLFFVSFMPILNVLFWFSDMTYTLELMLATAAWYLGFRGLREARVSYWIVANILASLAVQTKEPAVILIHVVWTGVAFFMREEIIARWKSESRRTLMLASIAYTVFVLATVYVLLFSPTGSNRFYRFSEPRIWQLIHDRMDYYGSYLFSIVGRVTLVAPLLWVSTRRVIRNELLRLLVTIVLVSIIPTNNIWFWLSVQFLALLEASRATRNARLMLPFFIAGVVVVLALMLTITMVKTQLTELAVVQLVLAGWAWSEVIEGVCRVMNEWSIGFRRTMQAITTVAVILGIVLALPKLSKQEELLRNVQRARFNANEAVRWIATHAEHDATVGVTGYQLHGIDGHESLATESDEAKVAKQYTFFEGFVFLYLGMLDRPDIKPAYLEDSTHLREDLDTLRTSPSPYLLLQTQLDVEHFHRTQLLVADSQCTITEIHAPYPCEVWRLLKRN